MAVKRMSLMQRRCFIQCAAALGAVPALASSPDADWLLPPLNAAQRRRWLRHASSLAWQATPRQPGAWSEWLLPVPADLVDADGQQVYQPERLGVMLAWTMPDGEVMFTDAFWAEWGGFRGWVARLMPQSTGQWRMSAWLQVEGRAVARLGSPVRFTVDAVDTLPVLRVDARHPRYFADEAGHPFFGLGMNMAWAKGDVAGQYRTWFDSLAAAGGNLVRIWMSSWCFGIEWQDTGLGCYQARQAQARLLDEVLALAQARGIRVVLCLLNHGAFSLKADSEWQKNPYNSANGGPLAEPQAFFTSDSAIRCFENRIRYLAARWSHSPALHSWEWWNEVTWVPHQPEALLGWLRRVSQTMRRFDPYQRLQTSSWADTGPTDLWNQVGLDYVQQHDYTPHDLMERYRRSAQVWQRLHRPQPMLPGELGGSSRHPSGSPADMALHQRQFHDGLWVPFMLGYASTALYWWWDHFVAATNQWHWLRPLHQTIATLDAIGLPWRSLPAAQPGHPGLVPVADSEQPGEGPPQAATAGHATASPPGGWHGLECWVRADATCMLVWLRRPGLIGGQGDDIPPLTLSWQPGNPGPSQPAPAPWTGHVLQTDQTSPIPLTAHPDASGTWRIRLPAFSGSAVFWLQAAQVHRP